VPLAGTACELMFQVIADRAEKAAVIVTTNLPFSEWSQVIPKPNTGICHSGRPADLYNYDHRSWPLPIWPAFDGSVACLCPRPSVHRSCFAGWSPASDPARRHGS
jgi:IstB-like ATP binding protein